MNNTDKQQLTSKRKLFQLIAFLTLCSIGQAESSTSQTNELADLSLDELMNVNVTSVAGVRQEWFQTPAAIHVIKPEDLQSSGHQTLADALRLVPGVHVARESSNIWAISTRGFNGRFANKQLVMIDGRVVYDQFFAGVMWDIQQPMLADISTIEVVRGPGTTLWGGNAVNGVISVSTLNARDTQGLLLNQVTGIGDLQDKTEIRYGGKIAEDAYYRIYGQFLQFDNTNFSTGESSQDNWDMAKGGIRFDFGKSKELNLSVEAGGYGSNRIGTNWNRETLEPGVILRMNGDDQVSGGHFRTRLGKETDEKGWSLQLGYDQTNRKIHSLDTSMRIVDLDFRNHFRPDSRNEVVWGFAVRHSMDTTNQDGVTQVFFDPADSDSTTYSGFIQNTYALVPDHVFFMLGSKFEHNDFTGFECQPSARLWWSPNNEHTVWTAVSRSVRVPTRTDTDLGYNLPSPVPPVDLGNDDLKSEVAWTYEAGYRTRAIHNVTLDVTGYITHYGELAAFDPNTGTTLLPLSNLGTGQTTGLEFTGNWQARSDLSFSGSYSLANTDIEKLGFRSATQIPSHMFHVGSHWDLTKNVALNTHLYFVDHWFDGLAKVPSYYRLDLGLRWKVSDHCEVSIWGQNLLDNHHAEIERSAEDIYSGVSEVGRSALVQLTYQF